MENKNLFSAIKTFINNTPVGQTFTTKQLIGVVGSNETLTRWKNVNSNPFYRTHTYKAYLKRTGFVSFLRKGVWKIEKHLPESYNLGTIEFLLGYKGKTYNGMTREEILNPMVTSLKLGDILEFDGEGTNRAKKGAKAIYKGHYIGWSDDEYIRVEWIRDELSDRQEDGGYYESQFKKVEEVSTQKEDRILDEIKKEKVMKKLEFNFEEGKQRVIAMMLEHVDNFIHDMMQDIRSVINEDRDETLDQIEEIIESIRYTKRNIENATERVKSAITIQEVLEAMNDTMFEDMEETVLGELFGVDIVIE
jgi:hypothetical protein